MKKRLKSMLSNTLSGAAIFAFPFKWTCLLFFSFFFLLSCSKKEESSKDLKEQAYPDFTAIPAELPPPIKAKYIDPDSIAPPTIVPMKKQPKVVPAHTNIYPVGTPDVVQIPKDVRVITFGENGVPHPITVPARKTIVPALQPKPVPALAPVYKDDAVYNINYLSDEQGMQFGGGAILEDSRGNFWFGGPGGVVRYDGKNFFHYTEKEGFLASVFSFLEDSKGNIWMGSWSGMVSYDGQHVTHYAFDNNDSRTFDGCYNLIEDSKGNIWFSNHEKGNGVFRFDGTNFTLFERKYWQDDKPLLYTWDHAANRIFEDSRGQIWWTTEGSGIMRFDGRRIIQYTKQDGLIEDNNSAIFEDSKGNIWFGSNGFEDAEGLFCYIPAADYPNGKGGTFHNYTTKEGLSSGKITGIMEDARGNLWFSTRDGGINRYDGKTFTHFKAEQGLNTYAIYIMEDHFNNIWTGSRGKNGIGGAISDDEVNRFQPNSFVHFTEKQGISNPTISAIEEDSKGNIWFGTLGGGVIKYDGQNFTNFTQEQGLCDNEIHSIIEDRKGNIWIASRNNGVSRFDGKTFTNYSVGQGITFELVWDIFEDSSGNLWFACGFQGGVVRLDPDTGKFTQFDNDAWFDKDGIGLGSTSFHEDSQDNLWLGGKGWVIKHNPDEDQLEMMYFLDPVEKDFMEYMLEDNKGNLWFGYETGLVKVNKEEAEGENKFTLFTKENGLPDGKIQTIVEDNQKNVWISSDKGLALLVGGLENMGKRDWIQYGKPDGLKSNGYVCNSVYLDSKNRMWWGTGISGVTRLDLNTFSIPTEAPQNISLSHIEINQQFLDYRNLANEDYSNTLAFGEIIKEKVDSVVAFQNYPTTLSLPYDLNHLTFHFSAIDWSAPHKIQYSYQMEGLDKEWSNLQTKTEADYRNLSYGTFTFKVKAIGEAQIWSEPFSYTFTIQPPWWHTWWAYALYALLAVGASGWYIQRLRRKIQQKQEQLDRELQLNEELAVTNKQLAEINVANSRFVPKDFLHILGKDSLLDLQLGDQTETTMTILFADIRSYTSLSEKMTPEENFKFINAFLGRMGPIIQENGGFISQYLGDGIMALFKGNHQLAIKASIEMQQALQSYNKKRFVRNQQSLRLGIGLNTGKLMLGVIGDKNRYEPGVISDAVNTASRMEGLTKVFGCSVIVSEKTLAEIESDEERDSFIESPFMTYRFLGKVKVKGKNQTLKIYDFFDGDAPRIQELKLETKADFERAIYLYFDREFGKAADLFKMILKKFPEDIATEYYMEKVVEYVMNGVDANWNGVEEMVSK